MTEAFFERDLAGARFERVDLAGATFDQAWWELVSIRST
jgi:uncharacterized protein YjbI with pentapeptide repeats